MHFLCAEYNAKIVVLFVLIYVGYLLAIGTGLLLNKSREKLFCVYAVSVGECGRRNARICALRTDHWNADRICGS